MINPLTPSTAKEKSMDNTFTNGPSFIILLLGLVLAAFIVIYHKLNPVRNWKRRERQAGRCGHVDLLMWGGKDGTCRQCRKNSLLGFDGNGGSLLRGERIRPVGREDDRNRDLQSGGRQFATDERRTLKAGRSFFSKWSFWKQERGVSEARLDDDDEEAHPPPYEQLYEYPPAYEEFEVPRRPEAVFIWEERRWGPDLYTGWEW